MNHEEKRVWMIQQLLREDSYYKDYQIPNEEQEQKNLLRALMNVRLPKPISEEFLTIQDAYLSKENAEQGYITLEELEPVDKSGQLYLWQGDITRLKVDAIVNAANSQMCGCFQPLHSCIDNAIPFQITHRFTS